MTRSMHDAARRAPLSCLLSVLLSAAPLAAHSTILTFDQARQSGTVVPTGAGSDIEADYGDRVSGPLQRVPGGMFTYGEAGEGFTPNVVAEFVSRGPGGGNDASLWTTQYGDLVNVAFGNQFSNTMEVRLIADAGYSVLLHGFDLAGWRETDYMIAGVQVLDANGVLFTDNDVRIEGDAIGPRHSTFTFTSPLEGNALTILIDYGNLPGTQQDNIGIDNIRFGQHPPAPIPEPASTLLMLGGAGLVCMRIRSARQRRG